MWSNWVVDVTTGVRDGLFCFIPIEGDGTLVIGMNYLGPEPTENMSIVGVVHADGQGAVEQWCDENPDYWEKIKGFSHKGSD